MADPPFDSIAARAAARFDGVRAASLERVADGRLVAEIAAGHFDVPGGWCLSTIARLTTNAPELLEPVRSLQMQLMAASECYRYPLESLHISLLGLTPRTERERLDRVRQSRAIEITRATLADLEPCTMQITGLNLLGNQWFLEIVPSDERWANARQRLGKAALAAGESPMIHPDAEPIHLNIARITGAVVADRIGEFLTEPGFTATWAVSAVELFLTDFVVDPAVAVAIDRIELG